jgi:hypothetical protein
MNEQRDRLDVTIKQVFAKMKKVDTKSTGCLDDELLAAYLEGGLTEQEREKLEYHLVHCEKCTDALILSSQVEGSYQPTEQAFSTKKTLRRVKDLVEPRETPSLWERVSSWFFAFRPVPVMVAASVILMVVTLGIYNLKAPLRPSPGTPSSITLGIIARRPSDILTRDTTPHYREVEIEDGGVLHSGDRFRIKFELREEAYVYLLFSDSQGNLTRLFPERDAALPVKVEPFKTYVVPERDGWFGLDESTGQETFYLVAFPEAIGDIDQKIDQLRRMGMNEIGKILPGAKFQPFSLRHE